MNYQVKIPKGVFNDSFIPLLEDKHRYLVIYGGSGSGKSVFVVQRYIKHLLTDKMNLLVIRNTGRSNRDSTYALFKQIVSKWNLNKLFTFRENDMRISCINGNEIVFSGLDDVEKLKSITFSNSELSDIWVEEASEILESDFNQLDVRLRGKTSHKQIVVTFNPININHWLKRRFVDNQNEDILVHHSTYLDNKFVDDAYKKLLESYKETDPYYYNVYCLGNWGVIGDTVFDAQKVQERINALTNNGNKGYFEYDKDFNYKWIDSPQGYITIYSAPKNGHKYVIGGDTASGVGSDYSICQVLDAESGVQVCVLRNRMDSDLYAKQTYCLARYYNDALVSIESNFDLYPIKWLEEKGYTNQYVREQQDTFTHSIKKAFGFRTDSFTRPRILSKLIEIVREYTYLFNDKETLEEMLTFVRNDKGRPEAQEGSHDDLVMALAIAHDSITQVRFNNTFAFDENDEDIEFYNYT